MVWKPNIKIVSGKVSWVLFLSNESYTGPSVTQLCLKGNQSKSVS